MRGRCCFPGMRKEETKGDHCEEWTERSWRNEGEKGLMSVEEKGGQQWPEKTCGPVPCTCASLAQLAVTQHGSPVWQGFAFPSQQGYPFQVCIQCLGVMFRSSGLDKHITLSSLILAVFLQQGKTDKNKLVYLVEGEVFTVKISAAP